MIHGLDFLPHSPTEHELRALVAAQVGPVLADLEGEVVEVAYDVPALTTLGRWWVRGSAPTSGGPTPFSFFVKAVQPWSRSPLFEHVPPEHRDLAALAFPWATEPAAYRSDLGAALPTGLRMPRAYAVLDHEGPVSTLWLEAVPTCDRAWDLPRYTRAAHVLGRLAASAPTRERAMLGDFPMHATTYLANRLTMQVVPILHSPVWEHPGLAPFADMRGDLLDAVERLPSLVEEVDALPRLAAHGDACPNNLLADPEDPDGFVLIDYGLWNSLPLAHDLTQLLVGDVQVGRRRATELGGLAALDQALLAAYAEGLAAEDLVVDPARLRRAHALQLFVFAGVSSLPFELLDLPVGQLLEVAEQRAAVTRFSLDLLEQTS